MDAAEALIFHHPEIMTLRGDKAAQIAHYLPFASGLIFLAQSIRQESKAHEEDARKPSWVNQQAGKDFRTGKPTDPIWVWSAKTQEYLQVPLRDVLQKTKDDPALENQCWTVQAGTTQVAMTEAPAGDGLADAPATYTVKEKTAQSGVEHNFSYDAASSTATVNLKNYYLRWLQVTVDQYGPGGEQVGQTQVLGQQSPVDTIMAIPLAPDWSPYQFTWDEKASRAVVSFGGIGQPPADGTYDIGGTTWTAIFNFAVPMLFITIGVAEDQEGQEWSDLTKSLVGKLTAVAEAAAEGPLSTAVTGGPGLEDVLLAIANLASSLLLAVLTDTAASALKAYLGEALTESMMEVAEPLIGWVALAIGAAADIASIVETSVEVGAQPRHHGHQHRARRGRERHRHPRWWARGRDAVARHRDALRDLDHL